MKIESPDDIDLLKVVKALPYGPHRLRAFMIRGDVEVVEHDNFLASVQLTSSGPKFQYSKPLFDEYVENYIDVAFVTFHELLHVLSGHLDLEGMRERFRLPGLFEEYESMDEIHSQSPSQLDDDDVSTFQVVQYASELEIKHMEHVLLPDEKFHEINKRMYGDADHDSNKIMYREAEDIEDYLYQVIHRRVFSTRNYSPFETFRALHNRKEEISDKMPDMDDQSGEDRSGDSEDAQESDSSKDQEDGEEEEESEGEGGGGEQDEENEDDQQQGGGNEQGEENDEEGKENEGNEGEGEDEEENEDENQDQDGNNNGEDEERDSQPMMGSESEVHEDAREKDLQDLQDALSEILDEAEDADGCTKENIEGNRPDRKHPIVDDQKRSKVENKVRESRDEPDFHSRLGEILDDKVGSAIQYSVVPNLQNDHQARIGRKLDMFVSKYRHEKHATREKVAFYYDCSSSQDEYIPVCNEIALRYKRYFAEQKVFVFGSDVHEVKIGKFTRHAENGTVTDLMGNRGTSFRNVIEHVKEKGFRKIIVLTDDKSSIPEDLMESLLKKGKLRYILVLATQDPDDHFYGGFIGNGYATEHINLELDKQ